MLCDARQSLAQVASDSTKGHVYGIVSDSAARPITGAVVSVVGIAITVTTDERGRFAIQGLPVGLHLLRVRSIGFLPVISSIEISRAETVDGSLVLRRLTPMLDTMRAVARSLINKPARLDYTTRYDDFYLHRRTAVGGRFYTREQIDSMPPTRSARDVANQIPFFRVVGNGGRRCRSPTIFVDNRAFEDDWILDALEAGEVEAMEYYRSVAAGGPGVQGCSLYIWTR